MMLGGVIRHVVSARGPINMEVALFYAVTDPIKTHVDGLGTNLLACAIGNARGGFIVGLHGSGGLGMAEFVECVAKDGAFFAVEEEGAELTFSC